MIKIIKNIVKITILTGETKISPVFLAYSKTSYYLCSAKFIFAVQLPLDNSIQLFLYLRVAYIVCNTAGNRVG